MTQAHWNFSRVSTFIIYDRTKHIMDGWFSRVTPLC